MTAVGVALAAFNAQLAEIPCHPWPLPKVGTVRLGRFVVPVWECPRCHERGHTLEGELGELGDVCDGEG